MGEVPVHPWDVIPHLMIVLDTNGLVPAHSMGWGLLGYDTAAVVAG